MSRMAAERLHLVIRGRVQDVAFRAFVCGQALVRDLVGWVRNMPDGTVEVVVEGEREKLVELLALCRKGTRAARIDRIDEEWGTATDEFSEFNMIQE